jgi:phosphoribosyl 1,2-cyclic phosphate phosphodiesterase
LTRTIHTIDFTGQLIVLGTGTSVGVPAIGCPCEVCQSENPRNKRTRCAVVLGLPQGNLLIDTPPDLRQQLLREQIGVVHSVLFTHEHADHLMGLDDLRLFQFYLDGPVPLYCEPHVEEHIRSTFAYAFSGSMPTHAGAIPQLEFHSIDTQPFTVLGRRVVPIRLDHGPRFRPLGFRIGNVAYCTDVKEIPPESWPLLEGLDCLILDALRYRPHETHMCLEEAIEVVRRVQPRQAYFTHIAHDLEHEAVNRALPAGIALAYDGLRIPLS